MITNSYTILFFALFLISQSQVISQNLVPNPGFEIYTECPDSFNQGETLQCLPWQNANQATSDCYNVCSNPSDVGIPNNYSGVQDAHSGVAYGGCWWTYGPLWREYLQVQLLSPCIAGYLYKISFYVSLAESVSSCGIEEIGIYFSSNPPWGLTIGQLKVVPQVESEIGVVSDTANWVLITGCFYAKGGEQWITIGNFSPDNFLYCNHAYYYIDDVSVVKGDSFELLDLELGDPILTCDPFEIDPGITGVEFNWSDGSTQPTLLVTTSGIYSLTISIPCSSIGIDSIEVFFNDIAEGIDLGPPEDTLCEGDSYIFSLDPNLGKYVWQDGSTDPEYTITTTGVYQVSLDDGCDITSDTISILVTALIFPDIADVPDFVCENDTPISLPVNQSGISGWWSGQQVTNNTFDPSGLEGIVSLTFSPDPEQCAGKVTRDIYVNPQTSVALSGVPDSLCPFHSPISLPDIQDGTPGSWSGLGVANNIFNPQGLNGDVLLTFTPHPGQCALPWTTSIIVGENTEVMCEYELYAPTVFSPNGDEANDRWRIYSTDQNAELVSFAIFDRWGSILFSCSDKLLNDAAVEWDGSLKGMEMEVGVYVFVAVIRMNNGVIRHLSGDIALIR